MKHDDVGEAMEKASALTEVVSVKGIIQDQHPPVDFYALGVAGCIDRLAAPLRRAGVTVHWHTPPHHGIEISSSAAALLYHVAQETFSNTLNYANASQLTVRLNAVYHASKSPSRTMAAVSKSTPPPPVAGGTVSDCC